MGTKRTFPAFAIALVAIGCSRSKPPPPEPVVGADAAALDASVGVDAGSPVDASVTAASVTDASAGDASAHDAGVSATATTLDAYCKDFVARTDEAEGFRCNTDVIHSSCVVKPLQKLPTVGTVVRLDDKEPAGAETSFALVNAEGRFVFLLEVPTEECDIGDPAAYTVGLVSATEDGDAGAPTATIVIDSLRVDPPLEGKYGITVKRIARRCRAGAIAPECDAPTTIASFQGPSASDKPPPFSKWKKG
ncbi:MAG TPA: hypothetical protein VF407_24450, partial [Polyangiaceae bacterium]